MLSSTTAVVVDAAVDAVVVEAVVVEAVVGAVGLVATTDDTTVGAPAERLICRRHFSEDFLLIKYFNE